MISYIPLFIAALLFLVAIEWFVSYKRGDQNYSLGNVVQNLAIGAMDQLGSLIYFVLLFFVLSFVYKHFSIVHLKTDWKQWVLAYIAIDFLSYWYHRYSHEINILWAGHVTHHSSSFYNFSNGFRTSVFQGLNRIAFWALLPIFGFHPFVLLVSLKVSGIYDFLLHTAYIPKLGSLEKILITPSMHRVHHGKNDLYIDKNYGSTFVIWDKLFGTYQEETEPVVYGIKAEYADNNPINAIGHHYKYLWQTMHVTPNWPDKLRLIVSRPSWTPPDLQPAKTTQTKRFYRGDKFRTLAIFQLCCAVPGFIVFMLFQPVLNPFEVVVLATVLCSSIVHCSLIFNNNLYAKFEIKEMALLLFSIVATILAFSFYINFFLLFVIGYLAISALLLRLGVKYP